MLKRALLLTAVLLAALPALASDRVPRSKIDADRVIRAWDDPARDRGRPFDVSISADPWLVVFRLCAMGRAEIASDLASSSDLATIEGLGEQVNAWCRRPIASDLLERWDGIESAFEGKEWRALLDRAQELKRGECTFLDLNVDLLRGQALTKLGEFEDALPPLRDAAEHAMGLGWLVGQSRALWSLGHALVQRQECEGALEAWSRCAAVYERLDYERAAAITRANLGALALQLGDARAAVRELDRVIPALKELEQRVDVALFLRNRAVAKGHLGEYAGALADLNEARRIAVELEDVRGMADSDLGLATTLTRIGDFAQAERAARGAIAGYDKAKARGGVARGYGTLGLVLFESEDLDGAAIAFETCRVISVEIGDDLSAAKAMTSLAVIRGASGEYAEAITDLRQALAERKRLQDARAEVDALYWVAEFQRRAGEDDEAKATFRTVRRLATELDLAETLIEARLGLAEIEFKRGKNARAMREVLEAVEVMNQTIRGLGQEQGAMARAPRGRLVTIGLEAAAAIHDAAHFSYFLESGRAGALLESLEARESVRNAAIPEALRKKEEVARTAEAAARARYGSAREAGDLRAMRQRRKELDRAQAEVRDTVEEIHRHAVAGAELLYPQPMPLAKIRKALSPTDALVKYALLQEKGYALVATRRDARVVELGKASTINAHAARVADLLANADSEPTAGLAALHELVIKPLRLQPDVTRLLVVPDGNLYLVPLQTLAPDHLTTCIPSATTVVRLRPESETRGKGVLALGDPAYRKVVPLGPDGVPWRLKLTSLPGTREEATAVGTEVLLGEAASEAGLRQALQAQERWRAVHLACHGLIDPRRPMRSALALTPAEPDDGILTALEVLQMRINADLVALSACESGRGTLYRGEGLVGLTRAFMIAGAPRLLVSLWEVDDEATHALMVEFYTRWAPKDGSAGLEAAAALSAAQQHVRAQKKWEHPHYWAAWVLWGIP